MPSHNDRARAISRQHTQKMVKFGRVVFELCVWTDRHADRRGHHNAKWHPFWGALIMCRSLYRCQYHDEQQNTSSLIDFKDFYAKLIDHYIDNFVHKNNTEMVDRWRKAIINQRWMLKNIDWMHPTVTLSVAMFAVIAVIVALRRWRLWFLLHDAMLAWCVLGRVSARLFVTSQCSIKTYCV